MTLLLPNSPLIIYDDLIIMSVQNGPSHLRLHSSFSAFSFFSFRPYLIKGTVAQSPNFLLSLVKHGHNVSLSPARAMTYSGKHSAHEYIEIHIFLHTLNSYGPNT